MKRAAAFRPQQYKLEAHISALRFPVSEEPIVSIIIPVYNQELYTYNCLKSILKNTGSVPYEIILIDDCSDSKTREFLAMVQNIRVYQNRTNIGFLKSCNFGAKKGKGKYLLFLNNDTMVTPGWLSALLKTFELDQNAGLVGSKLIYPDGRLQEAGGIFWKDASAWNYGKFDDPNKPEYNYLREADYCSGACLLIPRQLFYDLGLFDERYAPAYYEDADLAFRIREAGKRVYYNPQAVIVHFEGITSGMDLSCGVKQYQEINQGKFYCQWQHILTDYAPNGVNPELEKERNVSKRILVLDARMLTPDQDSGSYRMFYLLKILKELNAKVTFAPVNLFYQKPYVRDLQELGIEVLYSPYVTSLETYLRKNAKMFDIIMMSRAEVADRFIDIVKTSSPNALLIFDTVDLHFIREARMAELKKSHSLRKLAQERKDQELEIASKADITLVVSPAEKEILQNLSSALRVEVISNIHETQKSVRPFSERKDILFIGGFEHPPNTDAICYYVRDIFPLIRQKLGDVKMYIIGSNMPRKVKSLASQDIIVPGYVKDISAYLNRCRVFVAPMRYGAGVKGKVNMSMSYGLPVVATTVAAEGMFLKHEVDILIADDPELFANEVVRLYEDAPLWEKLSVNGLKNVEKYFSRETAKKRLERLLG